MDRPTLARRREDLLPCRSMKRLAFSFALALLLAGCGSSAVHHLVTSPASATATAASANSSGCRTVALPTPKGPQHLKAPTLSIDPAKTYTVTVVTNCGT